MLTEVRSSIDYQRMYLQEDARYTLEIQGASHDPIKKDLRRHRLVAHPEERRTIDTVPLREVVVYRRFVCHPSSSIARGEAIEGSDVDFGLVITDNPVTLDQQATFVAELKKQGFVAHTERELEDTKAAMAVDGMVSLDAKRAYIEMSDAVVRFRTRSEMEARVADQPDPLLDPLSCLYLGSAQIH